MNPVIFLAFVAMLVLSSGCGFLCDEVQMGTDEQKIANLSKAYRRCLEEYPNNQTAMKQYCEPLAMRISKLQK